MSQARRRELWFGEMLGKGGIEEAAIIRKHGGTKRVKFWLVAEKSGGIVQTHGHQDHGHGVDHSGTSTWYGDDQRAFSGWQEERGRNRDPNGKYDGSGLVPGKTTQQKQILKED